MRVSNKLLSLAGFMLFLPTLMTACSHNAGEPDAEIEAGDTRERADWLRFRRMYPDSEIPEGAREYAWEALIKQESEPGLSWR
ncbi:MAG: hypothetical protein DMF60_08305, partial [Acidobacteria bacterium]